MTSTTRADISPEDVLQVVDEIAGAFLAASVTLSTDTVARERDVVACVHVTGSFRGSVICAVSKRFAALCAQRMLAVDIAEVDEEAVADAIGEIVNMIGGSVKALLPESSALSLPVVTIGDGQELMVPGTVALATVDLRCADEPLRVTVLEEGPCVACRR